ncbi:hypothetical protein [Streptomyces sp. NPDC048386]|uniref:hypothetical protein n=1 Tax=Streptomyces sp. NPDC048386 TaxID=3365541 RepID=UPI00370F9753
MARMLCQICGGPTPGTNGKRTLFLVGADGGRPIQEAEPTASPPVHAACARLAVDHCPSLRRRWSAALVSRTPVWGVAGLLYHPRTLTEVPRPDGGLHRVPFTDQERLPWILASRLMVTLQDVTPVLDLDDLTDDIVGAAAAAP